MRWAQRLKRVFKLDLESCEGCGGQIKVIACLEHAVVHEPDRCEDPDRRVSAGVQRDSTPFESRATDAGGVQTDVVTTNPGRGHLPRMKWSEESQQVIPTVSAALESVKSFPAIVSIAASDSEWLHMIDKGLEPSGRDHAAVETRKCFAYQNDWDRLVDHIAELFGDVPGKKPESQTLDRSNVDERQFRQMPDDSARFFVSTLCMDVIAKIHFRVGEASSQLALIPSILDADLLDSTSHVSRCIAVRPLAP